MVRFFLRHVKLNYFSGNEFPFPNPDVMRVIAFYGYFLYVLFKRGLLPRFIVIF